MFLFETIYNYHGVAVVMCVENRHSERKGVSRVDTDILFIESSLRLFPVDIYAVSFAGRSDGTWIEKMKR